LINAILTLERKDKIKEKINNINIGVKTIVEK
jgi:hypothetical protein